MKTFKTPIYKNLEFAFTTDTYAINGNICVGIWCKEGDCIEPFANLTVNLDLPLIKNTAFIHHQSYHGLKNAKHLYIGLHQKKYNF